MVLIGPPPGGGQLHPPVTTAIPSDIVVAKPGTRLERAAVTVLLLAMIALPAASTLSRRFLGHDLPGASVLAQHITLWVGFLGALLATASERHLGLSTLGILPDGPPRRALHAFGQIASAAACALLAWASIKLVEVEWDSHGEVAFGIRVAWSQLVMPLGFAVMALRFAWMAGACPQQPRPLVLGPPGAGAGRHPRRLPARAGHPLPRR